MRMRIGYGVAATPTRIEHIHQHQTAECKIYSYVRAQGVYGSVIVIRNVVNL